MQSVGAPPMGRCARLVILQSQFVFHGLLFVICAFSVSRAMASYSERILNDILPSFVLPIHSSSAVHAELP